ncbi:hypothetical protein I6J42_33550 [Streptomyces californicus]|uniref:Uncharacterized protein n=1 Tax=Streptomyces californicus TaxID=67351 RepID=A0ABD7DAB2_9ACTN|nr:MULTISPECIES: hypothetical protein [Streptomyces]QRV25873.1 hypothetical protein I6J39_00205 [Streptomyces californicus]QRV38464.1 hypothetical protein I6J42_33550 [Streptomyces californicus]QRV39274.1 hypothetical protein I6J41_00035 [Streptomyces californicus]QRV46022.1 hypothetical protein I6J43_00070 [Streptomyces californicus]
MTALALTVALAAGYLLGRLRPWRRLGDWTADQIRHTGPWARGGHLRQAALALAHLLTAPRTSLRTPSNHPPPARDPDWAAHRTRPPAEGNPT